MVYFTASTASTQLLLDTTNNQEDIFKIVIILSTNCISFEENIVVPYVDNIYKSSISFDNIGKIVLFRYSISYHYLHDLNNFCHQLIHNIIQRSGMTEDKIAVITEEY